MTNGVSYKITYELANRSIVEIVMFLAEDNRRLTTVSARIIFQPNIKTGNATVVNSTTTTTTTTTNTSTSTNTSSWSSYQQLTSWKTDENFQSI